MKNLFNLLTILGILFLTSCNEEFSNPQFSTNDSDIINYRMGDKATRKLKSATVTDHETGKTETYYDCSEKGGSCDVGEKAGPKHLLVVPTDGSVNETNTDINIDRLHILAELNNSTPTELKTFFTSNSYSELFPYIYKSDVYDKIVNDIVTLEINNNFLLLIENKESIFAYSMNPYLTDLDKSFLNGGGDDLRVAKFNTQTNIMECIEKGTNCNVKVDTSKHLTPSQLYAYSEEFFPNSNLKALILGGEYSIKIQADFYKYVPANEILETYYIKR